MVCEAWAMLGERAVRGREGEQEEEAGEGGGGVGVVLP